MKKKRLFATAALCMALSAAQGQNTSCFRDDARRLYTINAALLPSVNQMVKDGTLGNYFEGTALPADAGNAEIRNLVRRMSEERVDLTKYLMSALAGSPDDEVYGYRLTSINVEKLTGTDIANGQEVDYMTSATPLTYLAVEMQWGQTRGGICSRVFKNLSGPAFNFDHLQANTMVIPREGVSFSIRAVQLKDKDGGNDPSNILSMGEYRLHFIPAADGKTTIEEGNIKATFTYERCTLPMETIHKGMARTLDFYKQTFGRDSYDGKGAPVYNLVYYPSNGIDLISQMTQKDKGTDVFAAPSAGRRAAGGDEAEADTGDEAEEYLFTNSQLGAFAIADYNPYVMLYGMGGYNQSDGVYLGPACEITTVCHEFTHHVTRETAALSSGNSTEGGALNESFSDIMAISMMKMLDGSDSWLIGGNGFVVGKSNLRDMKNPKNSMDGIYPGADTYKGEHWDVESKYVRAGVQNKFYCLLADGGSGKNDNGYEYSLTGIGIGKACQIAYLTLTKYAKSDTDYSKIRDCWLQAAAEKYGSNGAETEAVGKAWDAVGVYKDGIMPTGIQTLNRTDRTDKAWMTPEGRRLPGEPTRHGVYIHQGKKVIR